MSQKTFYIITRHKRTLDLFSKLGGKQVENITEIPPYSLVVGVLPIDLIAEVTKRGGIFISVGIDPAKFKEKLNVDYNPKTADSFIEKVSDSEFIDMLRFMLYSYVDIKETTIDEIKNEIRNAKYTKIYYVGSPVFASGLQYMLNLPLTNRYDKDSIAFSPIEGEYYSLKVLKRDLIINDVSQFAEAIKNGIIKIYKVVAKAKPMSSNDVFEIIKGGLNCLRYLELKGYNLKGYSPDTYYLLSEKPASDECVPFFTWLEYTYG